LFSYIHIPFCESKCKYCNFASTWKIQIFQIQKYINFLLFEIDNFDKKIEKLESIYFGWWTPTTLSVNQLSLIINKLELKFWFNNNIEITLETTPNKITIDNLWKWKSIWINRISIWVQSLNNITLSEIWRWNKWNILTALEAIKSLWFNNVSIDFIIWLPHVSKWEIKNDIEFILDKYAFIKHISVYMLEDQYYPWKWKYISINEEDYLWEYVEVLNFLESKWFYRYEISNFSKKWYECRHNKSYWNHSDNIWFWLGAHSYVNNYRFANPDNFIDYYSWKISYNEKNTDNDLFIENIMFWLRTDWIEIKYLKWINNKKLEYFINNWYLYIDNNKLFLSIKGTLLLDYILKELL